MLFDACINILFHQIINIYALYTFNVCTLAIQFLLSLQLSIIQQHSVTRIRELFVTSSIIEEKTRQKLGIMEENRHLTLISNICKVNAELTMFFETLTVKW